MKSAATTTARGCCVHALRYGRQRKGISRCRRPTNGNIRKIRVLGKLPPPARRTRHRNIHHIVDFPSRQIFLQTLGRTLPRDAPLVHPPLCAGRAFAPLLAEIGVENVTIAGDTRFDRVTTIRDKGRNIPQIETFKAADPGAPLMVVGSSWERDEDVYIPWLHRHPDCRAVIAPHEFDKTDSRYSDGASVPTRQCSTATSAASTTLRPKVP